MTTTACWKLFMAVGRRVPLLLVCLAVPGCHDHLTTDRPSPLGLAESRGRRQEGQRSQGCRQGRQRAVGSSKQAALARISTRPGPSAISGPPPLRSLTHTHPIQEAEVGKREKGGRKRGRSRGAGGSRWALHCTHARTQADTHIKPSHSYSSPRHWSWSHLGGPSSPKGGLGNGLAIATTPLAWLAGL